MTETTTLNNGNSHQSTIDDLEKKIIRQIEYYLGDVNMVRDKFLKNEITKDDGWISLAVLTTFKRLQSLTTDFKTIVSALKKSLSGLLQIDESGEKIRRDPSRPVPASQAELELALRNRTVFVKGFPKTAEVTIDKLLEFFEQFGSIESVQMKKQFKSKDFSGAAFVVFPTEDKAKEFVEKSKTTPLKFDENSPLECSLQDDHYKKKALEAASGVKTMEDHRRDKQTKKDKRKEDLEKKTNEHLEKLNSENLLGAVIHLVGMTADTTRELIKEKFLPFSKLPWIDFNKGDAEAWVRLNEANTAKDVLEKVLATGNGKLTIQDKEITARVIEGDEEAKFWKEANEKRAVQRTQKGEQRFAGGKRGKRNRRGGQKRKRGPGAAQDDDGDSNDDDDDEKPSADSKSAKKAKNDDED